MKDREIDHKTVELQRRQIHQRQSFIRTATFQDHDDENEDIRDWHLISEKEDIDHFGRKTQTFDLHKMLYFMASNHDETHYHNHDYFCSESSQKNAFFSYEETEKFMKVTSTDLNYVLRRYKGQAQEWMSCDVVFFTSVRRIFSNQSIEAANSSLGDKILPFHFIICNRHHILNNELVQISEKELMRFCAKLAWLHPHVLHSTIISSPTMRSKINGSETNSQERSNSVIHSLDKRNFSERALKAYEITRPVVTWLMEVYSHFIMQEKKLVTMPDDSSIDKREILSRTSAQNKKTEDLTCTSQLFNKAQQLGGVNGKVVSEVESLNIEVKAPHHLLKAPGNVMFLLRLLSMLIDQKIPTFFYMHYIQGFAVSIEHAQYTVDIALESVITLVSGVPGFIKTLLYLSEDSIEEVFSLQFMKHVICADVNIRSWLIPLLLVDKERAVSYMNIISKYLSSDVNGIISTNDLLIEKNGTNACFDNDIIEKKLKFIQQMRQKRDDFFERFRAHQIDRYVFYAVNAMDDGLKQRAAGTCSIQHLVDERFKASRFPFCLLITDGLLKVTQFIFFQVLLFHSTIDLDAVKFIMSFEITGFGVIYSLCRKILQTASLQNTTELVSTYTSIWNILDWATIIMVLTTIFALNLNLFDKKNDPYTEALLRSSNSSNYISLRMSVLSNHTEDVTAFREFLNDSLRIETVSNFIYVFAATALIMQALNFVVYFRLINEHFAVSVIAITQITKNVRWFIVVLLVINMAFSHVFLLLLSNDYTEISCVFRDEFVTAANSGNFNKSLSTEVREEIENIEQSLEQCRLSIQYRLMYEMMLGRWDSEFYEGYAASIFVFIFTFYVTLIMLNIVIAIASESYVWAKENGPLIFRSLRIEFAAEVISVEEMCGISHNHVSISGEDSSEQNVSLKKRQKFRFRNAALLIVFVFLCGSVYIAVMIYKIYSLDVDGNSSRDESFLRNAIGTFIFCVFFMLFCFSFLIYAIIFASNTDIHRENYLGLSKVCDFVTYEISLVGAKGIGFICYDQT